MQRLFETSSHTEPYPIFGERESYQYLNHRNSYLQIGSCYLLTGILNIIIHNDFVFLDSSTTSMHFEIHF